MYSFEYTPLYNFTGIQFSPNESLKRQLRFSFLLINCSFMKTSETCKKLIYSFKGDTEINDHFAAPIQLQMLGEKLWNTSLSYKRNY